MVKINFAEIIRLIKYFMFGSKGEPIIINRKIMYFIYGSRPTKFKYEHSQNEVNRNDVLQTKFLLKSFNEDSIFYDVGAHYGTYTLIASAFIDKPNQIFSFEPDRTAIQKLALNLQNNKIQNKVHFFETAVSSATGELLFDMQDGNSNSHLITNDEVNVKGQSMQVSTTTLNEFIKSHPRPTLIKIDTEGAELDILMGATDLLQDTSVQFICELHPFAWDWYENVSWTETAALLKGYNRQVILLDPNKSLKDLPYYGTIVF